MSNRSKPSRGHTAGSLRAVLIAAALAATSGIAACGGEDGTATSTAAAPSTIPQPSEAQLAAAGLDKLPLAAESKRLDITAPTFSNPTEITNPLFPISGLHSEVCSGRMDGKPFRSEITLLPRDGDHRMGPGSRSRRRLPVHRLPRRAHRRGRARPLRAGRRWIGLVSRRGGVRLPRRAGRQHRGHLARGRDGPTGMIMPADPQVGDVYRPENVPEWSSRRSRSSPWARPSKAHRPGQGRDDRARAARRRDLLGQGLRPRLRRVLHPPRQGDRGDGYRGAYRCNRRASTE